MSDTLEGMMTEEEFLQHMADLDDDALEHFGVKGMRWGKRKAPVEGALSRSERRAANKAAYKTDIKKLDSDIDAARARIKSGANRANYKAAKAQYKIDKQTKGSYEARKAFDAVKQKNIDDANLAQLAKSGRETVVTAIAAGVGAVLITAALVSR